jgi:hypothetical protein
MRVLASAQAAAMIQEEGGRLYVWLKRRRCCGAVTTLAASTEPPASKDFRLVDRGADFELYIPSALTHVPEELHLDLRRFPRRVEAYWNGCAWVS